MWQSVSDGGMLCVTCTDMAVLNGNHPEVHQSINTSINQSINQSSLSS